MSAIIKSEMISRRKALSLMGLAAAFGLAAAPTVLTVSDAEAQTAGMERRQERRAGRHERREVRRAGRHERREARRTGTTTGTGKEFHCSAKSLIEPATRPPPELKRQTSPLDLLRCAIPHVLRNH